MPKARERVATRTPAEYVDGYPCPLKRAKALTELADDLGYLPPGHATLRAASVIQAKERADCAGGLSDTQIADKLGITQPALSKLLSNHAARLAAARALLLQEQHA